MEEKVTYRTPAASRGTPVVNVGYEQIDLVLISRPFKNAVLDASSSLNTELDTDNFPITCMKRCKFKKTVRKNTTPEQNALSRRSNVKLLSRPHDMDKLL